MKRFLPLFSLLLLMTWAGAARAEEGVIYYGNDWVPAEGCDGQGGIGSKLDLFAETVGQTIYLNFDGATLTRGQSNAPQNSTSLINLGSLQYPAMDWSRFGGKEAGVKAITKEVKILYQEFAVTVVTERPTSGDYTMCMIGGTGQNCAGGGAAIGVAPLDCRNGNKNDIVLIFGAKIQSTSPKQIAFVIAHELGHSFGLEHVKSNKDIMYYALNPNTCCWTSSEIDAAHANGMCKNDPQDAKKVLAKNIGVGEGDKIKPLVWWQHPAPGAVLPSDFTFSVAANDNYAIHKVNLYVDGVKKEELSISPYTTAVTGLSDGEHTLKVEVFDGNVANKVEQEITVTVDSTCVKNGSCYAGQAGAGLRCATGGDCLTGACALDDKGDGVCSVSCTQAKDWEPCPEGLTCQQAGGGGGFYCAAAKSFTVDAVEQGGCAVTGRAPATGLPLLLALIGLVLSVRRRSSQKPL